LKEVVNKKEKKVEESYINMMSYPHAQDSPTSKMKSYLLLMKSLLRNFPLKYALRKFMIALGNGQVCFTKSEVSLDLRLAVYL